MNISEAIKLELKKQGMTQASLAEKLGITRQQVYNNLKYWDSNGLSNIQTLKKWSKAIGVDYKIFLKYL